MHFGRFTRFFSLDASVASYFNLFRWKNLKKYEQLSDLIEAMLLYFYNFFTNLKSYKKILLINQVLLKIKKKISKIDRSD